MTRILHRLARGGALAVPLLIAALVLGPAPAAAQAAPPTLSVTGRGEVRAVPDMARLQVGVAERADRAAAALAAMGAATAAVLDRLAAAGIAPEDLQTRSLRLGPVYSERTPGEPPRIAGFEAVTDIDVTVRDLEALGAVLDAVVADGANRLGGIAFDMQDRAAAQDEARRLAVVDAKAKAALYAEAANVALGDLTALREAGGDGGPRPFMEAAAFSDRGGVPVAPGEIEIAAEVLMEWRIDNRLE